MSRCAPAYKAVGPTRPHAGALCCPDGCRAGMDGYLSGGILTQKERQLLKAADRLSALIKCVEGGKTRATGNLQVRAQQTAALACHGMPGGGLLHYGICPAMTGRWTELSARGQPELSAVFSAFPAEAPARARSHGPGP